MQPTEEDYFAAIFATLLFGSYLLSRLRGRRR